MAHLHLPVQHTDDDLAIAGALAQVLRCEELYVTWTAVGGPAEAVVPARIHRPDEHRELPQRRRPTLLARLFGRR